MEKTVHEIENLRENSQTEMKEYYEEVERAVSKLLHERMSLS